MLSRRIFVFGSFVALAGCQTTTPHGLSAEEVKKLNIVGLDVSVAPGAPVDVTRLALAWARTRLPPPEGGMTYDPANPGASDPRMIDWSNKLQALASSPEAQAAGQVELARIVKQQSEPILLGQPGGDRAVTLKLSIRKFDRSGSRTELVMDAQLQDPKTKSVILANSGLVGSYNETQPIYAGSLAGLIATAVVAGVMAASAGDPSGAAARDAAQNFRNWLIRTG